MTNYASMAKRIRACDCSIALNSASVSMDRLYNAGMFTESEFMRLDDVWTSQSIKLEGVI